MWRVLGSHFSGTTGQIPHRMSAQVLSETDVMSKASGPKGSRGAKRPAAGKAPASQQSATKAAPKAAHPPEPERQASLLPEEEFTPPPPAGAPGNGTASAAKTRGDKGGDKASGKGPAKPAEKAGDKAAQAAQAAPATAPAPAPKDDVTPAPEPETPAPAAEAATEAAADAPAGPRVLRYVNNAEGCWKELEDGTRVKLSEKEWQNALTRQFRRESPPTA